MSLQFRRARSRAALMVVVAAVVAAVPAGAGTLTVGSSTPAPAPSRLEPALEADLKVAAPDAVVTVIYSAGSATAARAAAVAAGLKPITTFDKVGAAAVQGTPVQIKTLAAQPGVRYLQSNRRLEVAGTTAPVTTRVSEAAEVFDAPDGSDLDGHGVGIAVVDSGMAGDHPAYQGGPGYFALPTGGATRLRNLKQVCVPGCDATSAGRVNELFFVDETGVDTDVQATGGHGTHVTGIAGGREVTTANGVTFRGVAPGAALYGIGAGAGIFTLNASASLSWVLEHHADPCFDMAPKPASCPPIKVVNNSYGSPGDYDREDIFALISERLVAEGVTVVWAAGNGDPPTETNPRPNDGSVNLTNPPGESPLPGVIMVANYDDRGIGYRQGRLNTTSSRGQKGRPETYPDVSAPGTSILSACRPYLPICSSGYPDADYGEISGTSMAAPHVAGVVALLLQARPDLTPGQIEDILEDTAYKFGDPSSYEPDVASAQAPIPGQVRNSDDTTSFDKGHGLVDLAAAIAAARRVNAPKPPANVCASGGSQGVDITGDATGAAVTAVRLPSSPALDMTGVAYSYDSVARTFTTTLSVLDLRADLDPPPPGTIGDAFDVLFTYGSTTFYTRALRDPRGQVFQLRRQGDGQAGTADALVTAATGKFDPVANTVTVTVPAAAISGDAAGLGTGSVIDPVEAIAWRHDLALLGADTMSAGCPFVVGGGTYTADKRDRKPRPVDASGLPIDTTWQRVDDATIAPAHANYTCGVGPLFGLAMAPPSDEPVLDPECFVYEITIPSDRPYRYLDIELAPTGSSGALSDLDLYLFDVAGREVASSAASLAERPTEFIALNDVAPGTYRILVQPYQNVAGATFRLTTSFWGLADPLPYTAS